MVHQRRLSASQQPPLVNGRLPSVTVWKSQLRQGPCPSNAGSSIHLAGLSLMNENNGFSATAMRYFGGVPAPRAHCASPAVVAPGTAGSFPIDDVRPGHTFALSTSAGLSPALNYNFQKKYSFSAIDPPPPPPIALKYKRHVHIPAMQLSRLGFSVSHALQYSGGFMQCRTWHVPSQLAPASSAPLSGQATAFGSSPTHPQVRIAD